MHKRNYRPPSPCQSNEAILPSQHASLDSKISLDTRQAVQRPGRCFRPFLTTSKSTDRSSNALFFIFTMNRLRFGQSRYLISIPGRIKRFSLLKNRPHRLWDSSSLLLNGYQGQSGRRAKLITFPFTAPSPSYGFMVCTGTALWFTIYDTSVESKHTSESGQRVVLPLLPQ